MESCQKSLMLVADSDQNAGGVGIYKITHHFKGEMIYVLQSINYSLAHTSALNILIKRIPWNAGSGASSPCSFARIAMFSSLFAVLELGGR